MRVKIHIRPFVCRPSFRVLSNLPQAPLASASQSCFSVLSGPLCHHVLWPRSYGSYGTLQRLQPLRRADGNGELQLLRRAELQRAVN